MKKFKWRSAKINILHLNILIQRYFRQILTNVGTIVPLLLEVPMMLLIVYITASKNAFVNMNEGNASINIFLLVVVSAMMGILNSYREICKEREILSREVYGGLDVSAYTMSKFIVLATIGILQCAVLFCGTLLFIDYNFANSARGYALCILALILVNLSVTSLGLFVSAVLKKAESAILPVLVIIIVQVVFCDCLITLPPAADLVKYLTPTTWGIAVFGAVTQMNSWHEQYFEKELYNVSPWISLGILTAITLLFLALIIIKLKRAYKQKD